MARSPTAHRPPAGGENTARILEVRGVVQGVGFRPFVWRLAARYGLAGWVRNAGGVVQIRAEGATDALEAFCAALSEEAPPLAHVDALSWEGSEPSGLVGFEVDESLEASGGDRLVSPDVATCNACLRELFDPSNRRYRYPFINCTDCGPRFTIIRELPYDRGRTSMREFAMCEECRREYEDPADRRFHAEPIACPACGPTLELRDASWEVIEGDPIERAAALLRKGAVVALKGLGGFHLACDATNEEAVAGLRARKERPHKPFAVMVKDLETARRLLDPTEHDEVVLASWQAPIVLVRDRGDLAASVAPGHRRQGAMLPSTPLHHLLLRETDRPLVMTSGNRSEEPICTGNEEARERLAGIADAFLVHDRGIVARYDDSVTRTWRGTTVLLRRARSFAPAGLPLSAAVRPALGCGAELHGTFCLAEGERAFVSQHIGDLETDEAMSAYRDALDRYRGILGIEPELVAHDLHPDFLTTRFAHETGLPAVAVQHHHAHVAAVMAEHGIEGQVIGVAFDGFGLGDDGAAWGGEFLICDLERATRVGHLRPVRLPGGDAAVRHPWRMAIAHALDAGCLTQAVRLLDPDPKELEVVLGQIESGLASPMTSSAGRLFDAVSALAGVCGESTYEGQPAMLLEQAAEHASREYAYEIEQVDGRLVLDTRPTVRAVVRDLTRDRPAGLVAGRFHRTLAAAILEICRDIRGGYGVDAVCLAGGVFQNDLLVSDVAVRLSVVGFDVYVPHAVPVGDGGISLGQVVVANARSGG